MRPYNYPNVKRLWGLILALLDHLSHLFTDFSKGKIRSLPAQIFSRPSVNRITTKHVGTKFSFTFMECQLWRLSKDRISLWGDRIVRSRRWTLYRWFQFVFLWNCSAKFGWFSKIRLRKYDGRNTKNRLYWCALVGFLQYG